MQQSLKGRRICPEAVATKAAILYQDTEGYYTPKAGDSDPEIKRKRARRDKLEENVLVSNLEVAIRSIATDAVLDLPVPAVRQLMSKRQVIEIATEALAKCVAKVKALNEDLAQAKLQLTQQVAARPLELLAHDVSETGKFNFH